MKIAQSLFTALMATSLLGACSAPSDGGSPNASAAPAPPPEVGMRAETPAEQAAATGTIEALDPAAKTITIAHGPVPALQWPAMTMTFQVREVDLTGFKPGDPVEFEFSAKGMSATITALKHR